MSDEAEQHYPGEPAAPHEVGRIFALGRREDGSGCPLMMVSLSDGSWTVYFEDVEDVPVVRLSRAVMLSTAEQILKKIAPERIALLGKVAR